MISPSSSSSLLWAHIAEHLAQVCPQGFTLNTGQDGVRRLSGGDINESFCLSGIDDCALTVRYFVKLNQAVLLDMFEQEACALNTMAMTQTIAVPKVLGVGQFEQYSYLLLEYVEIVSAEQRGHLLDAKLGHDLATLHLCQSPNGQFGFAQSNYIGTTVQPNDWHHDWGIFFAEHRLGFQLELLLKRYRQPWLVELANQLDTVASRLNEHAVKPALVHGDLWQGNYGYMRGGRPVIYDPAAYYGDAEVDLAMMQLFGRPSDEFFAAYRQVNPLPAGVDARRDIYNLYHLFNHANLFGSSYLPQAQAIAYKLLG